MDSLRGFEEEADLDFRSDEEPSAEAPPEIGIDERRMHVRAYNHWVSLLDGRPYPTIADVDPDSIDDFGPNSVLLDFSHDTSDPAVPFVGKALREECGLPAAVERIGDVPPRSLLSRLTDHYLQIIANRAPIGFEAEFVNHRGHNTLYRGILMPLSSDGVTIDFIYGVINWKEVASRNVAAQLAAEVERALAAAPAPVSPVWADGPSAETADESEEAAGLHPQLPLDEDAGLADRLLAARECAEALKGADVRSRAALYRALGEAYDFALAAEAQPADYAELLEDSGIKAQARAPMTPVVKLVFGADYDKTRLTEFAAALAYARREKLPHSALRSWLESFDGGLKGVVAAERRLRRPAAKVADSEALRDRLRSARPLGHVNIAAGEDEFVLLVARRDEVGGLAVVSAVRDPALVERAIRKAAA